MSHRLLDAYGGIAGETWSEMILEQRACIVQNTDYSATVQVTAESLREAAKNLVFGPIAIAYLHALLTKAANELDLLERMVMDTGDTCQGCGMYHRHTASCKAVLNPELVERGYA